MLRWKWKQWIWMWKNLQFNTSLCRWIDVWNENEKIYWKVDIFFHKRVAFFCNSQHTPAPLRTWTKKQNQKIEGKNRNKNPNTKREREAHLWNISNEELLLSWEQFYLYFASKKSIYLLVIIFFSSICGNRLFCNKVGGFSFMELMCVKWVPIYSSSHSTSTSWTFLVEFSKSSITTK